MFHSIVDYIADTTKNTNQSINQLYSNSDNILLMTGFPASLPMRFCIKKNSVYELVTDLQTDYITPASTNSAKSCVVVRTILALYPVTTAGKVYCDVYNATINTGCATHMTSTYENFSVQDYPGNENDHFMCKLIYM